MKKLLLTLSITFIYHGMTIDCYEWRERACGYEMRDCRGELPSGVTQLACMTNVEITSIMRPPVYLKPAPDKLR